MEHIGHACCGRVNLAANFNYAVNRRYEEVLIQGMTMIVLIQEKLIRVLVFCFAKASPVVLELSSDLVKFYWGVLTLTSANFEV